VNARHATPTANTMTPGTAERLTGLGSAGRPDSAATTGTWAIVLAGRREASTDVAIASTAPVAIAHQGRFAASTTCPVACCSAGA
jgi:hypothetical protein